MDEQLRRDVPELDALEAESAHRIVVRARGRAVQALLGALAAAAMVVGVSVPLLVRFGPEGLPWAPVLHGLAAGAGAFLGVRTHRMLLQRRLTREVRRELAAGR